MDLKIRDQFFMVGGAGSGFGKAMALSLVNEGARVLAIARSEEALMDLQKTNPDKIEILSLDLFDPEGQYKIFQQINGRQLHGAVINAGGPPATSFMETELAQWDEGYASVLRWKIQLSKMLISEFLKWNYGRLLYIESISVKQPVENLVLSNAFRAAVVGFVKTLSNEVASNDIRMNVLAPGYHDTAAMQRMFRKKAEQLHIDELGARKEFEKQIPSGVMGNPGDMAQLGTWLLSPSSTYVNGQTISHDGGLMKGLFG